MLCHSFVHSFIRASSFPLTLTSHFSVTGPPITLSLPFSLHVAPCLTKAYLLITLLPFL